MKVQRTGWVFLMTGVCRAQLADSRCLELMNSKKSPESGHNQSSCKVYVVWASQSVRDNHRAHL